MNVFVQWGGLYREGDLHYFIFKKRGVKWNIWRVCSIEKYCRDWYVSIWSPSRFGHHKYWCQHPFMCRFLLLVTKKNHTTRETNSNAKSVINLPLNCCLSFVPLHLAFTFLIFLFVSIDSIILILIFLWRWCYSMCLHPDILPQWNHYKQNSQTTKRDVGIPIIVQPRPPSNAHNVIGLGFLCWATELLRSRNPTLSSWRRL